MEFRKLRSDEIDCRLATVKQNGVSILLYKDARCDQNILDETVGNMNWQRHHNRDNANCIVSIWDTEKKMWIEKEDTGTESYTEKEKGLASDSFKRACFNWGIGRELYTAPFIWFPVSKCNITEDKKCYDTFSVEEIGYDGNVISKLVVKNNKSGAFFKYGTEDEKQEREEEKKMDAGLSDKASQAQKNCISAMCKKHKIDIAMLYSSNGITESECSKLQATQLINSLKKKYGDDK